MHPMFGLEGNRSIDRSIMGSVVSFALGMFLPAITYALYPDSLIMNIGGFVVGVSIVFIVQSFTPFRIKLYYARRANHTARFEEYPHDQLQRNLAGVIAIVIVLLVSKLVEAEIPD